MGIYWDSTVSASAKARTKVVIQTIKLSPMQKNAAPSPPASLPVEQSAAPSPPIQEEITKAPPKQEVTSPPVPVPAISKPPTSKSENNKQPKVTLPKPDAKETKKSTPAKKTEPVKKTVESAKKTPQAPVIKTKQPDEAAKKRQQEEAELEKKRQKERAEAEKKRLEEQAAAQEAAHQREKALLAKAKENLAKLGETRDKINSSSSLNLESAAIPKELGSLHIDALPMGEGGKIGEWEAKEMSYGDEVAFRLKKALRLPDYGAVTIKLTLDRTGKVVKIETTKSENSKNKDYIERMVPTLVFSPFGQKFQGASQYTFLITLHNDS